MNRIMTLDEKIIKIREIVSDKDIVDELIHYMSTDESNEFFSTLATNFELNDILDEDENVEREFVNNM